MKKLSVLLNIFLLIAFSVTAQTEKKLNKVMELTITEEGGANGAVVVWEPVLKRYYCPMAGNEVFPFQIFDAKGKLLSKPKQETLMDVRGMWYNAKTKKLYANGYNDAGWAEYIMDVKGNPTGKKILFEGMNQPDMQSVGTYDAAKNVVYFLNYNKVHTYSTSATKAMGDPVTLNFEKIKSTEEKPPTDSSDVFDMVADEETYTEYNSTTVIYTGIKGQELGLLNITDKRIDLFDQATGNIKIRLVLPDDAAVNPMFNFSYANGMYWLFNKATRIWTAYK